MIDRTLKLTPHFTLGEMIPPGLADLPGEVHARLTGLCLVLEAVRWHFGLGIVIHDAYRPEERNASVGGVKTSDHPSGRAADFHIVAGNGNTWEQNTVLAFRFLRDEMVGRFGQIILEDHREHYGQPGKLWVHVATPSPKHPGGVADAAAVLISTAPGRYAPADHLT